MEYQGLIHVIIPLGIYFTLIIELLDTVGKYDR